MKKRKSSAIKKQIHTRTKTQHYLLRPAKRLKNIFAPLCFATGPLQQMNALRGNFKLLPAAAFYQSSFF